jgi:hypothetical protein
VRAWGLREARARGAARVAKKAQDVRNIQKAINRLCAATELQRAVSVGGLRRAV